VRPSIALIPLLLASLTYPAHAQDDASGRWGLCAGLPDWAQMPPLPDSLDAATRFTADAAEMQRDGLATLTGDVVMHHGEQTVFADRMVFEEATGRMEAEGNLSMVSPELAVRGTRMESNLDTGQGSILETEYYLPPQHGRGEATRIDRPDDDTLVLHDATYTTCDPGKNHWLLSASRVTLDEPEGEGRASHVVLRLANLPVMYMPWISFPITEERKSGFLAPSIGNSDKRGFELETPYYWNIAPNYDATFTPRYMSDRGLQLNGGFRYLTPRSNGDLQLAWLDDDLYQDDRWQGRWRNTTRPSARTRLDIDLNGVSDKQYFDDLDTSLDVVSTTHLQQRADARWYFDQGDLLLRVQNYQTVSETLTSVQYPYRRMPQLLLNAGIPDGALGLDYGLRAEWVQFDHDDRVTGSRLDLKPSIGLPLRTPGSFLEPRVTGRYTAYRLDDSVPEDAREPDRFVPTASIDSGLIFEREASARTLQTLEPRLFYLYTPYRDQDDLPLFDTGELTFTFAQLFREDRFSGPDRVGDANQLSLALTSRFLDTASGRERFRASIGQILYFEDREVTLPGQPQDSRSQSDLAAELGARLGDHWRMDGSLLWDPETEQTARGSTRIQYRRDGQHVVNLGYRYRQDDIEQAELSFGWPLARRWNAVGRWIYALDDNRDLEMLGGVEYDSCCWKARFVARSYVTDGGTEYNDAIYFQLVLKGLTGVGQKIDELLEEGILGYELQD